MNIESPPIDAIIPIRRSGLVYIKKKPRFEEQSSRQASHEHVVPPKKRKTPHIRRSKRATLPGIINDEEWAMLEWEEDEQSLRHGKGSVERFEREASPFDEVKVDFSDDEHEEDGVHPVRLGN